jgi:hypothetical protein
MDITSIRTTTPEVTPEMARAERALKLFEERGDEIEHVVADIYLVPSCSDRGAYRVRYGGLEESCSCKDFEFGGGRACKHLLAVGAMHAARRSGVRVRQSFAHAAGDPFAHAGRSQRRGCPRCFGGYITLAGEDEGGHYVEEAVRCRRCQRSYESL